jgi:hypothetical protein
MPHILNPKMFQTHSFMFQIILRRTADEFWAFSVSYFPSYNTIKIIFFWMG